MSFLDDLLTSTRARLEEYRAAVTEEVLEQRIAAQPPAGGFRKVLQSDDISIVAEVKRATPSKGDLAVDLDVRKQTAAYRTGGAAAISILTEPDYFKGSLEDLLGAREAGLPVLRKDFIIDPWQLFEARAWGADAVLLIVRVCGDRLSEFHKICRSLGMDALVEVFDESEMDAAATAGAELIGINHRDLESFEVDPDRTAKLAPMAPDGATVVALSGVDTRAEVVALGEAGADAVLVGESLVRAADPAAKLRELRGA